MTDHSPPQAPVYLALLHYPILDREGDIITTAITNLDIHDGGRLAATYGLSRYILVSPLFEQISLVHRVRAHWFDGPGARKTPTRRRAVECIIPAESYQEAIQIVQDAHAGTPLIVGTSARALEHQQITFDALRTHIHQQTQPVLLVFGTGWGLAHTKLQPPIDRFLPPICGPTDYNHLSVRAAMAVTLDRLLGH